MKNEPISSRVTLCDDGKYRRVYELNLFKTPTIFVLVWKILFFASLAIFSFVTAVDVINRGIDTFEGNMRFALYFLIGMTVVSLQWTKPA